MSLILWSGLLPVAVSWNVAATEAGEIGTRSTAGQVLVAAADPPGSNRQSRSREGDLYLRTYFEDAVVEPPPKKSMKTDVLKLTPRSGAAVEIPIFYEGGTQSARFAKVVSDPTDNTNHVLQYWLKEARVPGQREGRFKGRIQMVLSSLNLTEASQRFRMYLPPDLAHYRSYPKENTWFTINELWFGARWKGHPHPFRITLTIGKEKGEGQPLRFLATGEVPAGGRAKHGQWKAVWHNVNREFEVPIGEWMDVEVRYRQGDATTGRFFLGIKRESDAAMTPVIDVRDWTYNREAGQPVPMTDWNPLKLYTSSAIVDHIRKKGGVAQIFFDDLEIRKSWPE
jgi:hypothetical protein